MLIGLIPDWVQICGIGLGAVAAILTVVGMIYAAIYIVRGHKISNDSALAESAINSLTAANAALSSRLDLVEKDNGHCLELKKQQDVVIKQQDQRIDDLRAWVTARDLVLELTTMTRAG